MRLRTLGPVNWDDIEVGEVFAFKVGYEISILYKKSKKKIFTLSTIGDFHIFDVIGEAFFVFPSNFFYRLPKEVQELWITPDKNINEDYWGKFK